MRNVENDNCVGMINKRNASGSIQALHFYKRIISLLLYMFTRAYICRITGMCIINIQCKLNSQLSNLEGLGVLQEASTYCGIISI